MDASGNACPLWKFACQLWKDSEIRQRCLKLQDVYGLNPNELIFAIWCAGNHRLLSLSALRDVEAQLWHVGVTRPVRVARKNAVEQGQAEEPLIRNLKEVELAAEQVELRLLYQDVARLTCRSDLSRNEVLRLNLAGFESVGCQAGTEQEPEYRSLLEQLATRCAATARW